MEQLVFKSEKGTPVTNSLPVSKKFGKEHKDVLEAVRNILTTAENSAVLSMFYETTYYNSQNKSQPLFIMNRDGFTLLVMGFTGKDALKFKVDFIEAFNKMEETIKSGGYQIPQSYSEALMIAARQAEQIELQQRELKSAAPKVEYFDKCLDSKGYLTTNMIAAGLGISHIKLNKLLCEWQIQYRQSEVNSIILFDESSMEVGIEFQKTVCDDGEPALCIQADHMKEPIILFGEQINNLKKFPGQ